MTAGLLKPLCGGYLACDLDPALAPLQINIEEISLPATSIDVAICFHVLEHVDDHKALSELHRILRPGGSLLLMVPIIEGWAHTYENPAIVEDTERAQHFGQADHVRYYGADFRTRVTEAGFSLAEYTAEEPHVQRHGLLRGEKLFIARKV
ncbi:class I SAM-dependent methyltransferase [Pseudophaeobacter sp. 1A16562]|uniref:methyltransferase domain-containing protein n=1 Tax=Rhodobacterales TaxID=204455 RepID=UPI00238085C9|nr:class I SAM-dependent methyltransferase [Phaeobacter sp. PT47_59]MDE4176719.1 class I SAM-dependent methyltransferase [Phaeobacter sp. PT47_59]MEC7795323.1 class I SAM-dependent methyltransferase [Pseudomonadota bacterium]